MVKRPNSIIFLFFSLALLLCAGCAASPWATKSVQDPATPPATGDNQSTQPQMLPGNSTSPTLPAPGPPIPSPMAAGSGAAAPHEMQQVMSEVQRLGTVDPRAQAQLLAELKQTDPGLWPLVVKNVRSRVAYARRFQEQQHGEQLADRRSEPSERCNTGIDIMSDYPGADFRAANTPSTPYPTTSATAEQLPLNFEPHIRSNASGADSFDPNVNPALQRRYNDRIERILAPPSGAHFPLGDKYNDQSPDSNQGAALDATPKYDNTARNTHSDSVVHVAYHAEPESQVVARNRSPSALAEAQQNNDWKYHLDRAIDALSAQLDIKDTSGEDHTDEDKQSIVATRKESPADDRARLRLLRLLAGHRDDALAEIPGDDASVRDFWSKQIFGLDILLDTQRLSRDNLRAAEAKRHLSDAVLALSESAALTVRNLAFCREVQSFGSIKPFKKREFSPGQRVLLYAEVDNFQSENTPRGYHTSLRSSFQIYDSDGRQIDKRESTTTEEYCTSPRRDYFIGCDFCLPADIYPGRHTLKLTVEDLKSHKVGESSIDFQVVKR